MNKEKKKIYSVISYALLFSILFFVVFGIVTVLIPNKFFLRMTTVTYLDYFFLILTSVLLGIYIAFTIYQKKHSKKVCTTAAYSGGVFGFLGFGCVICNKLLVLLLGVAGALAYIEPYRPFIGFAGVGLMSYAVYNKGKNIMWNKDKLR